MLGRIFAAAGALIAVLLLTGCGGRGVHFDPVQPPGDMPPAMMRYAACGFEEGLALVKLDRWPARNPKFREVATPRGRREISVLDGYRMMFAYPDTHFFANVKVERSDPARFDQDQMAVKDGLLLLAYSGPAARVTERQVGGVTVYGVDNSAAGEEALDSQRTLAVYVFFSEPEQLVTTVYLLNQRPRVRKFKTVAEFRTLRDGFLERLVTCGRGGS